MNTSQLTKLGKGTSWTRKRGPCTLETKQATAALFDLSGRYIAREDENVTIAFVQLCSKITNQKVRSGQENGVVLWRQNNCSSWAAADINCKSETSSAADCSPRQPDPCLISKERYIWAKGLYVYSERKNTQKNDPPQMSDFRSKSTKSGPEAKTLPEAQRTQGIGSLT